MGSKSSLPPHIPDPQKPVTCNQLLHLLKKGWKANRPYLLVATSQDIITPISLLGELHAPGSLHQLSMSMQGNLPEKYHTKLCFCLFCKYSGANDLSFLNHIMHTHYQANYGCGKCLEEVCSESQPMQNHFKECEGLPDSDSSCSPHHSPHRAQAQAEPKKATTIKASSSMKDATPKKKHHSSVHQDSPAKDVKKDYQDVYQGCIQEGIKKQQM